MERPPRTLAAFLGAVTLALPLAEGAAATSAGAAAKNVVVTKKLTGQPAEAGRWGTVRINVTVRVTRSGSKKTTVRYADLGGSYSYHSDRSQYIMSKALPLLRQEFLSAHSAR